MNTKEIKCLIHSIINNVEKLVPEYLKIEKEMAKSNGNVAVCVIDEKGNIYGRIFGKDKIRGRESYRVAWLKASQVWITGHRTGDYEKKVFNHELEEDIMGIRKPDFIGWEGGQPLTLCDGTILAVGFSGFSGLTDLEIMVRAASKNVLSPNNQVTTNNYQLI